MSIHTQIEADEASWEALRAECYDEFLERRRCEWDDFGDWLALSAAPHMRDHERYAAAMNYAERKAFERGVA